MKHKIKSRFTPHALAVAALLAFPALSPQGARAQGTTVTTWTGTDPNSISANQVFYLYNVGTGKFIMADGLWNTEPMLEYLDYGMPFTLLKRTVSNSDTYLDKGQNLPANSNSQTLIHSGMVTTVGAEFLGCNVNNWTTSQSATAIHGPLLDARAYYTFNDQSNRNTRTYFWRTFEFELAEGSTTDYILKETVHKFTARDASDDKASSYYLGAVWGTNGGDVTSGQRNRTHDTYHTAFKSTTDPHGAVTKDSLNYLWRFIPQSELDKAVNAQTGENTGTYGGLNANVTHLLHDPNFDRAQNDFYQYVDGAGTTQQTWTVVPSANVSAAIDNETNNPRWDWTFRDNSKKDRRGNPIVALAQPANFTILPSGVTYRSAADTDKPTGANPGSLGGMYNQPWNSPVLRKLEPSDAAWSSDTEKMNRIQYEMATLEGEGNAYQTVTITTPGVYLLTMHAMSVGQTKGFAFAQSDNNEKDSVMVAMPVAAPANPLYSDGGVVPGNTRQTHNVNVGANVNWPAVDELISGDAHLVAVQFTVPDQYNGKKVSPSNPVKWRVGVAKVGSEKSFKTFDASRDLTGGANRSQWDFYSDASYVAFDNLQLHYLGDQAPFAFDETREDIAYMSTDLMAKDASSKNGFTNRTTYLRRNAKTNKWQPLVLPVNLTTEQVRQAFGDDVRLGVLAGVGKRSTPNSPTRIDFNLVNPTPGDTAIYAWHYYLIRATREPTAVSFRRYTGTDDAGNSLYETVSLNGYLLSRLDYDPSNVHYHYTDEQGKTIYRDRKIDETGTTFSDVILGSAYSGEETPFDGGNLDLTVEGTWVKKDGVAPVHAYYVYDGTMYYLSSPQTVKGFKWWITANEGAHPQGLSFGFIDPNNTVTYIDGVSLDRPEAGATNAVYTLAGLKVADDASALSRLPKGIYITGGKKIINR